MKFIYTLLFYLAIPFLLLRLIWRGFRAPDYLKRWPERFGFISSRTSQSPLIWVHAVSVGEVEASRPLVKGLQENYPQHQLLITTMTPTGSERVKRLFGQKVLHVYLPYDMPFAIKRFLKAMRPQFGIIMETELWPNLLLTCHKQHIPLVIANARLSERSAKGYQRFAKFSRQMLQSLPLIATQTQADRQRFQALGAPAERVHAVGNLKYEINLPASLHEQAEAMRSMWGNRPVWIAASTHEGEEEIILNAAKQVRAKFNDLLLVIVPRHPERFDRVAGLCRKSGLKTLRRSENKPCPSTTQVLVVDTMGELPLFYAAADLSLIGGSMVPHGGHNLLEPAALGRAVITGPHYFNFTEITERFLQFGAVVKVNNSVELAQAVSQLLADPKRRAEMGEAGLDLINQSKGASARLLNLIQRHIHHA
ncbi:lipid IV(A) 3-deoxy-D-manno-octulosonic acid transferase [Methylophaga sp. OBS3]|uniref:lipid IV(A) 3-deoxy-D-manno-octulosonic acid transferase n=1 Tax=Methylophaga sp. OBS3 TaxID=2991934 RepID=UPI00224D6A1C|nr:lipid IV(A) 3-deoxy-D-manno-octulosonic acid transferase [Methylophaga sp. OBS3]MCX4190530.1 lipid IV(A) 3-deoxy-D-manno-octulosonic acid transferase [Methylophaga sp. OBS3]